MSATKNPPLGRHPQATGSTDYDSSNNNPKAIRIHPPRKTDDPFGQLKARLVLAQYRAGTLPEGVFVAMMAGVGLYP